MATLPWRTLLAYFVPVQVLLFVLYGIHRYRQRTGPRAAAGAADRPHHHLDLRQHGAGRHPDRHGALRPEGLGLHVTVMGLHGLTLLSTLTVIVEMDLARARVRDARAPSIAAMALTTLRNTIIHPVVLPLVVGWAWNLSGLPIPPVVDDVLELLSLGVVPVSLVVIGLSLAYYGLAPRLGAVARVRGRSSCCIQPAFVLLVAHWGFGLQRPAAVDRGADGRAAGRGQRADLRPALRDARGRVGDGDRHLDASATPSRCRSGSSS